MVRSFLFSSGRFFKTAVLSLSMVLTQQTFDHLQLEIYWGSELLIVPSIYSLVLLPPNAAIQARLGADSSKPPADHQ